MFDTARPSRLRAIFSDPSAKGSAIVKAFLWHSSLVMFFCIIAAWFILSGTPLPSKPSDSTDSRVIARVDGHSITLEEAERHIALPLYQLDQRRLQLLQYSVQQLIDAELLRIEAKRTRKTVEELLESTADARTSDQRQQALIVALRRSTSIEVLLHPVTEPVVPVSADDDPSIGSATAPVTIIEFSDFQCPYCRESVSVCQGSPKFPQLWSSKSPHPVRLWLWLLRVAPSRL
ncbi:thioredoxin domain-containing protein [Nitrospira sp. Nam80]